MRVARGYRARMAPSRSQPRRRAAPAREWKVGELLEIFEIKACGNRVYVFLDELELGLQEVHRPRVRSAATLESHGLGVVGHTAYYLPVASPFDDVRRAAVAELHRCRDVFAAVGV